VGASAPAFLNMDTLTCLVLVALTGHDAFRVREAATVSLERQGYLALSALLAGRHGCLETQARCRYLLARAHDRHAETVALWYRPAWGWPWIDGHKDAPVCWDDFSELLRQANAAGFANGPPDWQCYREATRLLVMRRLRAGEAVGPTLEWLWERERHWRASNGYPPPGPP
jgi:hypothetical protein